VEQGRSSSAGWRNAGWSTGDRLRGLLYLVSALSDFSSFIIVFTVSRKLADLDFGSSYLGMIGAGLSFSSGMGAILGGSLSSRFDGRIVFLTGTSLVVASGLLCALLMPGTIVFLPAYWLLGLGMGLLYPPLIGWLNQDEDAHAQRSNISRRLIFFCISWNLGMMGGQLLGGRLYEQGIAWTIGTGLGAACLNLLLAVVAVRLVRPIQPVIIVGDPVPPAKVKMANTFKRLGWIANLGGVFGGAMVIHLLSDLMVSLGIPAESHGGLLASWRCVIIASYLVMYGFTFWHYRFGVSIASQVLGALGLMVIALAETKSMFFLGLALQGQLIGFNYYSGLFYSTSGSKQEGRALAAGIHEATLAIGMSLGTIAGGWLGTVAGPRAPYWMSAGFILFLIAVQIFARQRWQSDHSENESISGNEPF